jgi:hypothetical protein
MREQTFPTQEQIRISGDDLVVTTNGVTSPQLRKRLKAYHLEYDRIMDEYREKERAFDQKWEEYMTRWKAYEQGKAPLPEAPPRGSHQIPDYPPFPEECLDMVCGAIRQGKPCKQRVIYRNGRCKFHGGLSTGPRTKKGKKRSAMNGFLPKKK